MDYYYEGQSKKVKSPEPTQLGQAKPPKEGYLTAEQAGYPTPVPEQKSAPPIENTPARAKAVAYQGCLEAQAGKK